METTTQSKTELKEEFLLRIKEDFYKALELGRIKSDTKYPSNSYTKTANSIASYFLKEEKRYRGLLMQGHFGTGKTYLMSEMIKFLKEKGLGGIRETNILKLRVLYEEHGSKFVNHEDICSMHLYIDDLGNIDSVVNRFGSKVDVFDLLFMDRYSKGYITHITTNLLDDDIKNQYGMRLWQRLNENDQIFLDSDSLRITGKVM